MKTGLALAGLLLALTAPVGLAASAAAAPPPLPGVVEVVLEQSRLNTVVGERLTLESRVVNSGDAPTDRLVAHLNVASLDGVYVDLEDWSADVTREVPPVAPGSSTSAVLAVPGRQHRQFRRLRRAHARRRLHGGYGPAGGEPAGTRDGGRKADPDRSGLAAGCHRRSGRARSGGRSCQIPHSAYELTGGAHPRARRSRDGCLG